MRSRAWFTLLFVLALALAAWFLREDAPRRAAPAAPLAAEPEPAPAAAAADLAAPQARGADPRQGGAARSAAEERRGGALDGERHVRVRVVTREGAPVEGAEVHLFEEPYPGWMARPTERTDAAGLAEFDRVLGGPFDLHVQHKGHGSVYLGPLGTGGEHVVVLDPEAQLVVSVADDAGKLLHGTTVRLVAMEPDSLERGATIDSDTRSDGRVQFAQLRPGRYSVAAAPPNGLLSPWQTVWLAPGANELALRCARGMLAHGVVVTGGSEGAVVPNATLALDSRPAWHPVTDLDGRFVLPVERAGVQLLVSAPSHAPLRVQVPPLALVEPAAGAAPAWRIVLEREVVLTGRIVDNDGVGRSGVRLELVVRNSDTPPVVVRSGEDGVFMLAGLPPDREAVLVARHGFWAPLLRALQTPREGSSNLGTLAFADRGAQLVVEARDARGKPLTEARVLVVETAPPGCAGLEQSRRTSLLDGNGRARIEDLPAGATVVQLWPRGSKSPLVRDVELRAREETKVLFEEAQGGTLQGRVVGPDGKAVAGVGVSVDPVESDPQLAHGDSETDAEGAYLVSGLDPERTYHITVWPPKPAAGARALRGGVYGPMKPGADTIRVELEELPWRTLLVRGKDGRPLAGAEVETMPLGGRPKDGARADPGVPAGETLTSDAAGLVRTPWPGDTPMRAIARFGGRTLVAAEIDWGSAPDPFPLDER